MGNELTALIANACGIDPETVRGVKYTDIDGDVSVEVTVVGPSPVDRCTVVFVQE